ncbi:MAG: GTP cyclohydrolase II [Candidatus Altiarchaeales archaeon]|nr:GTP cyclohydrolase II [Candidatus Altiarchaeales archaeon]
MKKQNTLTSSAWTKLITEYGDFKVKAYRDTEGKEHFVAVKGDVSGKEKVPLRIHSECLTGDVFHCLSCDCRNQFQAALKQISMRGGVLIYLRQEGRGIGLVNKMNAYALQREGKDTVEANIDLGFKSDERAYEIAAQIIKELNIKSVSILTNNPAKIEGLEGEGVLVSDRIPLQTKSNTYNRDYLSIKKRKLNHQFKDD